MTIDEQIRWITSQMSDPDVSLIVQQFLQRTGMKMSELRSNHVECAQLYRGIADMLEQDDILEDFRDITEPLRAERAADDTPHARLP